MNKWQKVINKLAKYEIEAMKKENLNISFRQHRAYIRLDIKEQKMSFENLAENKNFYRLTRKWFCPVCGARLQYDNDGAEWLQEWIECKECDYSRDLEEEDIELVYGFR